MERSSDAVRQQIATYVAAVVGSAAIPSAEQADVSEELTGHLEEAVRAGIRAGLPAQEAITSAIAAFGDPSMVGRDLMDTYRGRLWASTIGHLLPVADRFENPPGLVVWLARFDQVIAVFSALAAVGLFATATPVRATLAAGLGLASAAVLWLAASALYRGQAWALPVSTFVCLVNGIIFFASLGQPPGGVTLSINGLIGLVLFLRLAANLTTLNQWVAASRPIPGRLGWPVAVALVGWSLFIGFGSSIPDPTQIGRGDVRARGTVSCAIPQGTMDAGLPAVPVPTLDLRVTYDRVDAFPRGFFRDAGSWGDVIELNVGPRYDASLGDVRATGTAPDGTTRPIDLSSWTDIPAGLDSVDSERQIVAEILGTEQAAGRTIHLTVPTAAVLGDDGSPPENGLAVGSIVAQVRLHHLDRFTFQGFAECDKPFDLEPMH